VPFAGKLERNGDDSLLSYYKSGDEGYLVNLLPIGLNIPIGKTLLLSKKQKYS
jgi:hypothetical protein